MMLAAPVAAAQQPAPAGDVTFTKDIAPILQSKCQRCHRPDSTGPMPLITYEEARPWAKAMKARTSRGTKSGVMPPWHVEKAVGIAAYKDDLSLTPEQIAKFALWADSDAPRGNPADMPPPRHFDNRRAWTFEPDLVLTSPEVVVKASNEITFATIGDLPTGLTESRYVAAVQIREINDMPPTGGTDATVKGPFVIHHVDYGTVLPRQDNIVAFPRYMMPGKAETFDPADGHLMPAGSVLVFDSAHVRSNGRETRARLEFAFKFHPKDYKPAGRELRGTIVGSLDTRPGAPAQEMHAFTVLQEHTKIVTFDPHLPIGASRLCLEAITGASRATLTCAEYTGVGPQSFAYQDDVAPLLPKGTILHLTAFVNPGVKEAREGATPTRRTRVVDSKLSNTFLSGGLTIPLTDQEFEREMGKRRAQRTSDLQLGCPLCNTTPERVTPVANR
jgi:hypothetical protein